MRCIYSAPCGDLLITVSKGEVCECRWVIDSHCSDVSIKGGEGTACAVQLTDAEVMEAAVRQLDEYFKGERTLFEFPITYEGTPFRERVWRALTEIGYGETRSYSEVAEIVGSRGGQRAVAQACSANRLAIFVPCHRVISSSGSLGGYTVADGIKKRGMLPGGLSIKKFLLSHEYMHTKLVKMEH